jgi:hypothetical protein
VIYGRLPHSVQSCASGIVRDERVYHCVRAIFDRAETSRRAASIHVPHGNSARKQNQAVQSGMRLKCSLRTFANRACAFARWQISKPTYMNGPPAVFSAICSCFLARSDSTEALRRRLNSARWREYLPRKRFSLPRAGRSISCGGPCALRREVLRAKPMDARTDERSSRDSPKHDSTACDRNRWRARPTENTDAPIQTGKIPR